MKGLSKGRYDKTFAGEDADKAANMSTLKIKSYNINSLCVRHNPDPLKHI